MGIRDQEQVLPQQPCDAFKGKDRKASQGCWCWFFFPFIGFSILLYLSKNQETKRNGK